MPRPTALPFARRLGCLAAIAFAASAGTALAQSSSTDPDAMGEPGTPPTAATAPADPTTPKAEPRSGRGRGKAAVDRKAAAQGVPAPPVPGGDTGMPGLSDPSGLQGGRNVTATGRVMPPTTGRNPATAMKASTQADMLKAQKEADDRNRAWDSRMKKTMGSICSGC